MKIVFDSQWTVRSFDDNPYCLTAWITSRDLRIKELFGGHVYFIRDKYGYHNIFLFSDLSRDNDELLSDYIETVPNELHILTQLQLTDWYEDT